MIVFILIASYFCSNLLLLESFIIPSILKVLRWCREVNKVILLVNNSLNTSSISLKFYIFYTVCATLKQDKYYDTKLQVNDRDKTFRG